MSVLSFPKGKGLILQKVIRDFLWSKTMTIKKKLPLVAWDTICEPKINGGAGLRNTFLQNKALGAKLVRKIYTKPKTKLCKLMRYKYLDSLDKEIIFTQKQLPKGSKICNFISSCRLVLIPHLSWVINNGDKALFWDDA